MKTRYEAIYFIANEILKNILFDKKTRNKELQYIVDDLYNNIKENDFKDITIQSLKRTLNKNIIINSIFTNLTRVYGNKKINFKRFPMLNNDDIFYLKCIEDTILSFKKKQISDFKIKYNISNVKKYITEKKGK